MSGDMPMWKGLFEWSMKFQDGTSDRAAPHPLTPSDKEWLEGALKGAMLDLSNRMTDITAALASADQPDQPASTTPSSVSPPATLEEKERLLDELMELVENIDQAKDLSSVGGLPMLLHLMAPGTEPSLQWRAAEVVATCAQNNPEVQEAFFQGGVLPAVLPLLESTTTACQIKGLLALSCQIRGHAESLQWFLRENGIHELIDILGSSSDARVQRKCLQMLDYMLGSAASRERQPGVCVSLCPMLTRFLADSEDGDLRTAALGVLQRLSEDVECLRVMQKDLGLVAAVKALAVHLDAVPREDWGAAEDEAKLAMAFMSELTKELPLRPPSTAGSGGAGGIGDAGRHDGSGNSSSMQLMSVLPSS